jgi:3-deoxy-D-manno-octulosonic-acid transferase
LADRFLPWRPAWIAYNAILSVALVAGFPIWFPWMLAARKRRANFLQRLGSGLGKNPVGKGAPSIWVHSVSVGETLASVPFVRALKARFPSATITFSTVTLTGQEAAGKALEGTVSSFRYFPLDLPFVCGRFLDRIRPDAVVILETEIWPNFLAECAARAIPVAILNGRLSDRSFSRYMKLQGLFRKILADVDRIGAQTREDADRYARIRRDADGIFATGNMKYDMAVPSPNPGLAAIMSRTREEGGLWFVAGSTHEGEEEAVASGYLEAAGRFPSLRLLVAPRHPERFERVEQLLSAAGMRVVRKSSCGPDGLPSGTCALLLDTIGELSGAYAQADVAFVGGSLVPVGGHNLLEPAAFGVPVMTGTHLHNFKDMAARFRAADAAAFLETPGSLGRRLAEMLEDTEGRRAMGERGRQLMVSCQGATLRNVEMVAGMLGAANGGAA